MVGLSKRNFHFYHVVTLANEFGLGLSVHGLRVLKLRRIGKAKCIYLDEIFSDDGHGLARARHTFTRASSQSRT
jgi:hypothetical protein